MCNRSLLIYLTLLVLWGLNGCAGYGMNRAVAEVQPLEKTESISLEQAVTLAITKNAELKALSHEIKARGGSVLQAGLLPNPELEVEIEDVLGSGEINGTDVMESTLQISQLIETVNKRKKRETLASLEQELAVWDYKVKKSDLIEDVSIAFVDLLATQKQIELTRELVDVSKKVLQTVSERVKAGKVSPVEETKSRIALSNSKIEFNRAKMNLNRARRQLSATWGDENPSFKEVTGSFNELTSIPLYKELSDRITQNPDIARWNGEIRQKEAFLSLAEANAVPDVTLMGGIRYFNETDDHAFLFGASMPLPLFDRNQGDILSSSEEIHRASKEKRAVEIRTIAGLEIAYEELRTSFSEIRTVKKDILPDAESAFSSIVEGYRNGKFGYLDVLDSQRELFEVRVTYIDVLATFHKSLLRVKRLTGDPVYTDIKIKAERKGERE